DLNDFGGLDDACCRAGVAAKTTVQGSVHRPIQGYAGKHGHPGGLHLLVLKFDGTRWPRKRRSESPMDRASEFGQTTTVGADEPVSPAQWKAECPAHVGRYSVRSVLGEGGFGRVYLAFDEQLERLVAVKVPHRALVPGPEAAESYLAEARAAAQLDHPSIVPVYDVGSSPDCPCFIVSKYIEGRTLS